MKLGTKILLGFGGILGIAIVLGLVAIYMMRNVQEKAVILEKEYIPEVEDMLAITQTAYMLRLEALGIALSGEDKYYTQAKTAYDKLNANLKKFKDLVDVSDNLQKGKEAVGPLTKSIVDYWGAAEKLNKANGDIRATMKTQKPIGQKYTEINNKIIKKLRGKLAYATPETMSGEIKKYDLAMYMRYLGMSVRLNAAAAWRDRNMARLDKTLAEVVPQQAKTVKELKELDPSLSADLDDLMEQADLYKTALLDNKARWNVLNTALVEARDIGGDLIDITVNTGRVAAEGTSKKAVETREELTNASLVLIIGLLIAAVVGGVLAFVITTGITKPVNRIINNLTESGEQVAAASGQISSASQSLAEGATEQAASLEESSSALEEMASMTRQNADNAGNANHMMMETQKQVSNGAESVRNMASAMSEINDSSEQISRIIKTIEEIAFQTNLLALNAAVEAARAGDAGKGFAVVADEVRNLAQRSAQAARDTAELIESTVARVKNGTEIVEELQDSFGNVEKAANGVAGLINEISAASNEQAQGVDQVNTAVAQMDKVTQTNAANAEESASAAEELNAQAEQLRSLVGDLVKLVRGRDAKIERHSSTMNVPKLGGGGASMHHKPLSLPHSSRSGSGSSSAPKLSSGSAKLVKPNDVIPLDDEDDDFSDF